MKRNAFSRARKWTGRLAWIPALALANVRSETARPWNAALLAVFMALNNFVWFAIWWLFFGLAGSVRGWTLRDVTELYGVVAVAYGIYAAFFGGARSVAQLALDGGLDVYLGRPRSPLLGVLFSRSDPTGLGDIVSGIALIAWAAATPGELLLALGLAALGTSVVVATYVSINCLVFFTAAPARLFDQLFECFLIAATTPQIGLPMAAKLLLYTVLPAAFVGFLPVQILRSFSAAELGATAAAALVFPVLAALLFRVGLKRYASGNRMLDTR
ncbi:MAG TPA: ABC-2 family transporter protein [Gammaproteobacteria bacterium]|nr:ABC-2 family transporter protein [Gammaproteobacteria bacterium]